MIPKEAIEKAKRNFMRRPQTWRPVPLEQGGGYVCEIESKGKFYFPRVDYTDLRVVSKYRWYLKAGYAITSIAYKRVKMHQLLLGQVPSGMEIDHENRIRLDNRRANLRIIAANDNRKNQEGKGYRKRGNRYEAYIGLNSRQKSLGTFDTEEEARAAYKKAQQERIYSIAA